jgi:hypothetical protein
MKYSREQLIDRVRNYFKENKVEKMLVTSDGNIFHADKLGASYANAHARVNKLGDVITITADDLKEKAVKVDVKKSEKVEKSEPAKIEVEVKEKVTTNKKINDGIK